MLTKIGDALGSWTPRARGGDPLSNIRAAWAELVGVDVARAAQPVAITGDTLVVITASSAWSHQLVFLEPDILRGIGARLGDVGVVRLRFRVGAIRNTGRSHVRRAAGTARPGLEAASSGRPRPGSALEAFERFRAVVERSREAHRRRGGVFCGMCAAAIERGERCVPCIEWGRAEREAQCQRLLYDSPWLTPLEVLETLPGLSASEYDAIRRRLLRTWRDEMVLARKRAALPRPIAPDRTRLRRIASSYVLLETKIDPNRLDMDSPIRRNSLGDLYDFIVAVEKNARSMPLPPPPWSASSA